MNIYESLEKRESEILARWPKQETLLDLNLTFCDKFKPKLG